MLKLGTKAVPAVKYAAGLVGIAAALYIITSLLGDNGAGLFESLLYVIGLMVVLYVFSILTQIPARWLRLPALFLLWSICIFIMLLMALTIWAIFDGKPRYIADRLPGNVGSNPLSAVIAPDPTPSPTPTNTETPPLPAPTYTLNTRGLLRKTKATDNCNANEPVKVFTDSELLMSLEATNLIPKPGDTRHAAIRIVGTHEGQAFRVNPRVDEGSRELIDLPGENDIFLEVWNLRECQAEFRLSSQN